MSENQIVLAFTVVTIIGSIITYILLGGING